jgi:hypothetical protein
MRRGVAVGKMSDGPGGGVGVVVGVVRVGMGVAVDGMSVCVGGGMGVPVVVQLASKSNTHTSRL